MGHETSTLSNQGDFVPLNLGLANAVTKVDRPVTVTPSDSVRETYDDTIFQAWYENRSASQACWSGVLPQFRIEGRVAAREVKDLVMYVNRTMFIFPEIHADSLLSKKLG
jgi:hypothetical protein